jgi:hypothetical protein
VCVRFSRNSLKRNTKCLKKAWICNSSGLRPLKQTYENLNLYFNPVLSLLLTYLLLVFC